MPQSLDVSRPDELRDKALNLREAVNSSRARMSAQQETLERLRREIAELRALVDKSPLVEETASVSASAAVSFKTDARHDSWKPIPYIAIFFLAVGMQLHASRTAAPPLPAAISVAPAVAIEDDAADEALLLAREWRLPGDERPLSERLGGDTNPPGTQPEWTAERTGERMYRVSFRPNRSDSGYDFDVDLAARRVDPTPETAELISPRLVSRR